jgi:hypothetical protein
MGIVEWLQGSKPAGSEREMPVFKATLISGKDRQKKFILLKDEIVIGKSDGKETEILEDIRSPLGMIGNKIVFLKSPSTDGISKNHCLLRWDNYVKRYRLTVTGNNGIYHNGKIIKTNEEVTLEHNDNIVMINCSNPREATIRSPQLQIHYPL